MLLRTRRFYAVCLEATSRVVVEIGWGGGGGLEGSERLCAVTAALPKERFICYILNLFYPFYFNVIYIFILRISHIRSHYNIPIA